MLPEIDITGQEALLNSHVMIIGLGGLGSPASMYLASAGIGHLSLVDFDEVDLSNLQRQIVHDTDSINELKVESAKRRLEALNPEIKISTHSKKMSADDLSPLLSNVDLILDCSDNFDTRYALNDLAFEKAIPLVSGAAIGLQGQITSFDFRQDESPCYRCLYPSQAENEQQANCAENGVLGPLVGIIGSMQALESCKILLNIGKHLQGRLQVFDGLSGEWRHLTLNKDPQCSCSTKTK